MSDLRAEAASREILRAIRGDRSQVAFSRRLRYRGNVAAAWEAGRRSPTAEQMLRACGRCGIDVRAAFARFHPATAALVGAHGEGLPAWLDALRGSTKIVAIAARAGVSRFAASRWLEGTARPRVPQFLALVEAITGRSSDLVAALVPIERVPSLLVEHRRREAARRLAFDEPWTEAVLRVLESDEYRSQARHVPGLVAQRLGIDPETEARCLERMVDAGVISRDGPRLRIAAPLTVDTRAFPEALAKLRAHWARVALDRVQVARASDVLAYNVMSVSRTDLARIRELLRSTYREIRSIVSASEPPEVAALVNLQLVDWDAPEDTNTPEREQVPG